MSELMRFITYGGKWKRRVAQRLRRRSEDCRLKSQGWQSNFIIRPLNKTLNPQFLQGLVDPSLSKRKLQKLLLWIKVLAKKFKVNAAAVFWAGWSPVMTDWCPKIGKWTDGSKEMPRRDGHVPCPDGGDDSGVPCFLQPP